MIISLCLMISQAVWPADIGKVWAAVSGNFEYTELVNRSIRIGRYTGSESIVTIPKSINGLKVSTIGSSAFESNTALEEINLPYGVSRIEANVFRGCTGLVRASIPDSVIEIWSEAFKDCTSLEEVSIPSGLTAILYINIFKGCTNLKKVSFPDNMTDIGSGTFEDCSSLNGINIPNGVSEIKRNIFKNCTSLTEINIPGQVLAINDAAFEGCTGLTEISIPVSVASIGKNAFQQCSSLQKVVYSGTAKQWKQIEIDADGNDALLNAPIQYAADGRPTEYEYTDLDDNIGCKTGVGTHKIRRPFFA